MCKRTRLPYLYDSDQGWWSCEYRRVKTTTVDRRPYSVSLIPSPSFSQSRRCLGAWYSSRGGQSTVFVGYHLAEHVVAKFNETHHNILFGNQSSSLFQLFYLMQYTHTHTPSQPLPFSTTSLTGATATSWRLDAQAWKATGWCLSTTPTTGQMKRRPLTAW